MNLYPKLFAIGLMVGLSVSLDGLPSRAETRGLRDSYVGVTMTGESAEESLESLLRSTDEVMWLIDQATGESRERTEGDRQYQGRIALPNLPVSVRTTVVVADELRAVMPTLSYDMAIADGANIYAGAGYAFVRETEGETSLGDRSGVVLTTGAEASLTQRLVIYGDMRFHPDQRQSETGDRVRVQVGIGRRF